MNASLVDVFGRKMKKLRVSILDACNFRCYYCMPKQPEFMHKSEWLSAEQIHDISQNLVSLGLSEIRVTGGEPTLRKDFREIILKLSDLSLSRLGLTTNGFRLGEELSFLKDTNCKYINVSLDSLSEQTFVEITGNRYLTQIKKNIEAASKLEFRVKVNVVLMKGVNDDELFNFLEFAREANVELRFLELMKIGQANHLWANSKFISSKEVRDTIGEKIDLTPCLSEADSTSTNYLTPFGTKIGFISSESNPFCHSCSRLRLSASGVLRGCLMKEDGISLKGIAFEKYPMILSKVIATKPYSRIYELPQNMYQVGG